MGAGERRGAWEAGEAAWGCKMAYTNDIPKFLRFLENRRLNSWQRGDFRLRTYKDLYAERTLTCLSVCVSAKLHKNSNDPQNGPGVIRDGAVAQAYAK